MPIGASKVGALGGLVPGGSVTFNASDTWVVPPGVKKVSITGKGGTGNPGVAGNPGNPGNPGNGGAGGSSGALQFNSPIFSGIPGGQHRAGRNGGSAWKLGPNNDLYTAQSAGGLGNPRTINPGCVNIVALGGTFYNTGNPAAGNAVQQAAQSGSSGNAGNAGQAGCAGNPGQASSALCNTFPGGAGGNAPPGGAAGNGGSGGGAGGSGGKEQGSTGGGSAGNSAGAGGAGLNASPPFAPGGQNGFIGGGGGGGAGVTNSGTSGANGLRVAPPSGSPAPIPVLRSNAARGGTTSCLSAANFTCPTMNTMLIPRPPTTFDTTMTGGLGGAANNPRGGSNSISVGPSTSNYNVSLFSDYQPTRFQITQFNPTPIRPSLYRSGGGGGGVDTDCVGAGVYTAVQNVNMGGGGGGGGRGNVGNAGGNSPTVSGQAATPLTFNCVSVTPGAPYPIVVGGPSGGQVVISWNPQ